MTYQLTTFPNGLKVATEFLPGAESVAVTVSVGVGARYESEAENGLSHLLEHMAFKGTKTRSARDIAEAFDAVGGQANAFTSMEATVYFAKVLKEDVRLATDILGDIVQHSVFDETELSREKGVVIQEIAMHYDAPDDLVNDYFDETAFPNQPLGRSILSGEERIKAASRDDLLRYMDAHYRAPRIVLSAAGNIGHEAFAALAEEYFALPKTAAGPAFARASYTGGDRRVPRDIEQMHLLLGLPTVSVYSPDYYAAQLYAGVLGGGMSSRLFQEVREKRGLAYTVYATANAYEDCGMMNVYAACAPDKAKELSAVLCGQLAAMTKDVSDAELRRAKNQIKADLLMARENPQTVAAWIGRHLLTYGEYRPAQAIARRVDAVTVEDIARRAGELIQGKLTLAALGDVSGVLPYEELQGTLR
ncbi:MAG: insulinase family protein [Pseudomonadota bacterium]|nr:insulinase family protein [Pseudomonadota bacterium]MDE3036833.1 insulinase family protein [Pseudomonadota bacterium]